MCVCCETEREGERRQHFTSTVNYFYHQDKLYYAVTLSLSAFLEQMFIPHLCYMDIINLLGAGLSDLSTLA